MKEKYTYIFLFSVQHTKVEHLHGVCLLSLDPSLVSNLLGLDSFSTSRLKPKHLHGIRFFRYKHHEMSYFLISLAFFFSLVISHFEIIYKFFLIIFQLFFITIFFKSKFTQRLSLKRQFFSGFVVEKKKVERKIKKMIDIKEKNGYGVLVILELCR